MGLYPEISGLSGHNKIELLMTKESEMQIVSVMAVMVTMYSLVFLTLLSAVRAAERRRREAVPVPIRESNRRRLHP